MKWTVVWIPNAESELAQLWLDAPDRTELSHAAEKIDAELASNPLDFGESRVADERIAFLGQLAVEFTVDAHHDRVYVYHVRRCR
jgi:hypothetical protein